MLLELPSVPEADRPKRLPYAENVIKETLDVLRSQGWDPYDVRLMPNQTDGDRAEAVKSFLEGVRLGTVLADSNLLRFIELEAKVYGLLTGRSATTKVKDEINEESALETILNFGTKTPWATTSDQKEKKTRRKPGPKAKDVADG